MRLVMLFSGFIVVLLFSGCYTQFSTLDGGAPVPARDTTTREKEFCVWERDLAGFPVLRCYPSYYYPRNWYLQNRSPWWFRSRSHLFNARRCPSFYYYDRSCGCCRYYLNNPSLTRHRPRFGPSRYLAPMVPRDPYVRPAPSGRDTEVDTPATGGMHNRRPQYGPPRPPHLSPVQEQDGGSASSPANADSPVINEDPPETDTEIPVNRPVRRNMRSR